MKIFNNLSFQPLSPSELWHWVHVSYGDELGLTSSDDDYVPPPGMEDMKDHLKTGVHIPSKVCVLVLPVSILQSYCTQKGQNSMEFWPF